jgi:conjugative relaxase-like TrwC/TraI family protein
LGLIVVIGVRKLSPGGYQYLTGNTACADRGLDDGESLSDYYLAHGYPPGEWFGKGAAALGVTGEVTREQMNALFGEGRHPDSDRIQAEMIAAGHSAAEALEATKLGYRFAQYDGLDLVRGKVIEAYKKHNLDQNLPPGAPIDETTRAGIRRLVQAQVYADKHGGQTPSEDQLAKWLAEQKKAMKTATAGFELVLAPPKSVSLLLLGDEATRELAMSLHRQAVRDTLTYFENNVAFTRKGAGGYTQQDVTGITAAIFEHWDSRAGDPHLHTHVPISTKVQGPDGRWTSLDGRTVLAAAVTMSEFYNSRVRDLFRDHGAVWIEKPAGGIDLKRPTWELEGVPTELLSGFSTRSAQVEQERARLIVAFRRQHGREAGPKELMAISRQAQYDTRVAKQAPRSLADHVRVWRAQAEEMVDAVVVSTLGQRVFGGRGEDLSQVDVAELAESTLAVVSDYYSHFNTWNVEAEAHRQTAHLRVAKGARDQLIRDVMNRVRQSADLVALKGPTLVAEPNALRRRSGESVFVQHNSQRFTTRRTLREESALASWGRLTDGRRLQNDTITRAIKDVGQLNHGQRVAVTRFASSGRRVQLLYAPAGAGKTTTMKAYANAVRAEGGRVFAFGPSARAAHELATSIDAHPHTLHQVTTAQLIGTVEKAFPFQYGDVLIIDEVSMAGTHTLHDVVSYALRQGADVRLVGDDKQLAAVEAGGAVRWFEHLNGAVRLRQVVRFDDPDQAAASLNLHAGNPAGLDYYFDRNWIVDGSRETIRDATHRGWRADLDAGRQSLLIVASNEDVVALNLEARAVRLQRGDVDERGRSVQLHDGTTASKGDWVVTRHNDRLTTLFGGADFVKNGDTWDVVSVRRDGALKLRHQVSRGTVVVPSDYVSVEVELAYAATINRVQGMTSRGSAHAIAMQGLSAEQLYTLVTRAVYDNRVYVETHQHTIDSHQETPLPVTARGVLEAALQRSSAETPANAELRDALAEAESLSRWVGRHDYVATLGVEEEVDAVLAQHVPMLLENPAAPAVRATLRTAHTLGWQAEELVTTALASGPLDEGEVDDAAAVLQWRVRRRVDRTAPPARTATPTPESVNRWRSLIEHRQQQAAVEDAVWEPVWQVAAAAVDEGLDADAAIIQAARWLADRPGADPMPDHQFTAIALDAALRGQRELGGGWRPAVPWLAHPNYQYLTETPERLGYLERVNDTVAARVDELRATVIADEPAWTAALGPRPLDDPATAARWDELAGLGAAYRDTYNIATDDPQHPLGARPTTQGLRARAWRDLLAQWRPPTADEVLPGKQETEVSAFDRLRDTIDPDELLNTILTSEPGIEPPRDERLDDLVRRYERGARAAVERQINADITDVLTARAPSVLGGAAEPAVRWILSEAHEQGWTVEQIVPEAARLSGIAGAREPAAVLYRLIEQRLQRTDPPGQPAAERGPLPWLSAPSEAALAQQPELARHLDLLSEAITDRADQLRAEVAESQPGWSRGLGPRPADPQDAARWDDLAATAAAYRETYRVTSPSADAPLGAQPPADDIRAEAWIDLTEQWKPADTTAEELHARNQQRLDALLSDVDDVDHLLDDTELLEDDGVRERLGAQVGDDLQYDDMSDLDERTGLDSGLGY